MHRHSKRIFFSEEKKQKTFIPLGPERGLGRRDTGFTLLEVIVALVVLGFVLAGLAQVTHFGGMALGTQAKFSAQADDLARVDRVLRRLIENAAPPISADDKPFVGQTHRLVLTSLLPRQPPTLITRRAQVALGVDEQHRLLLRWTPHPNADPLATAATKPDEIVLLEGVDHLDLTYRQALGDGGKWKETWGDVTLPALVRLHIAFVSTTRHWPTMLLPTLLDPNGSF